jgi:hypothetical protein
MWTSADLIAACLLCKGRQELNNSAATQHPIPTHILSTEGMRFTSFLLHNLQIASGPCTRINMTYKKEDSCRWCSERSEWGVETLGLGAGLARCYPPQRPQCVLPAIQLLCAHVAHSQLWQKKQLWSWQISEDSKFKYRQPKKPEKQIEPVN